MNADFQIDLSFAETFTVLTRRDARSSGHQGNEPLTELRALPDGRADGSSKAVRLAARAGREQMVDAESAAFQLPAFAVVPHAVHLARAASRFREMRLALRLVGCLPVGRIGDFHHELQVIPVPFVHGP
jgi:hypothetical protein